MYKIRWREGGRQKSLRVHGAKDLAKKILRKKLSSRDENRHMDVKREVNFKVSALVERYSKECASKKRSYDREKSVLAGIQKELGHLFVREVDGNAVAQWYGNLTTKGLSTGTAVRHFNVMHHMMEKAAVIWSKETGIDRNPADQVEVKRLDDQRPERDRIARGVEADSRNDVECDLRPAGSPSLARGGSRSYDAIVRGASIGLPAAGLWLWQPRENVR